ncbi:MAG: protein translocase subunit SecD [Alphaproteobacteria bacterium]|nr:protein translocase subunit SecD [Alphaproteobacteria bacterium]
MRTSAWRMIAYALIVLLGALTALPNVLTPAQLATVPDWMPKSQVVLGLDLRGGAHIALELDTKALVAARSLDLMRQARATLADADIRPASIRLDGNTTVITLRAADQRDAASAAMARLSTEAGDLDRRTVSPTELRLSYADVGVATLTSLAVEQSLEIVRKRIDELGLAEASVQRVGKDRIIVQLPGITGDTGIDQVLGSTAKLTFHKVSMAGPAEALPPGYSWAKLRGSTERVPIETRPMLSGEHLADARPAVDGTTGEPVVTFRFDATGSRIFAAITKANVGRPFAIMMDGEALTAPVIQSPIIGGSGQISGSFSTKSASDLSAMLRAGALPAPLKVVEQRTVGPDEGKDAIERGVFTGAIGFVLVVAFLCLLYGSWGLVANLALALNVILTFAALTLLGATLTLPGIAGIVLGIGLAVDANVLINERIREETRKGMSAIAALDAGFKRAFSTIVDSNLTALIATALLFMFGTGPVRGFAVTMGLGIAISMFTAVTVVRVVMGEIVRRRKMKTLVIEPMFRLKLVPDGTAIPFMRARFMGLAFSAFLSLASIALFVSPGLNYGVDFKGGIQLDVATQAPLDVAAVRAKLGALKLGEIKLQQSGDGLLIVRVESQPDTEVAVRQIRAELVKLDPGAKIHGDAVGPRVSGELATTGILAVIFASLAMLAYIWARFEWPFAVGAIATLVLDVTKTVGFFALTGLEFNLTAIAALLTLIGYSVNDKVVVYDRMRENMRLMKSLTLREIIDRSINETLGRSLYTSVTALVAMLPMAIWGGSAVASFAIPMVFGIIVAASSSVFIAAPILLFLGDWRQSRKYRPHRGAVETSSEAQMFRVGRTPLEGEAALP